MELDTVTVGSCFALVLVGLSIEARQLSAEVDHRRLETGGLRALLKKK